MATTITVPVTGIDDIECHGGATLTPASVRIRYDRREQPHIHVSGPTRYGTNKEPGAPSFNFGACTCRKWLADLVERRRPKGFRTWDHAEWTAWDIVVGLWVNAEEAPDPHRNLIAALEFALADTNGCEVARRTLTQALSAETARVDAWKARYAHIYQQREV